MVNRVDTIIERIDKACELIEKKPKRAYRDLLALANEGAYEAMVLVGRCYLSGSGTAKNVDQAEMWLRRAHENGIQSAAYFLSQVCWERQDYKGQHALLIESAATGDTDAIHALERLESWCHADGEPDMLRLQNAQKIQKSEPYKAFQEFRALAQEGSQLSIIYMGWAYFNGLGVTQDNKQAEAFWQEALQQGTESIQNYATNALGGYYLRQKDYSQARHYFQLGASKGFAPAFYHLGHLYKKGSGIDKNYQQAEYYWRQAMAKEHLLSQRELAFLLMSGRLGVRRIWEGWALFFSSAQGIMKVCIENPMDWRLRG